MGKHYIGKGLMLPSISYKRFLKLKSTGDFANGCIVNVYDKSNHENDGIYACINDKFYKLQVIDDIQGNNIAQGVQGIQGAQGIQGSQGVKVEDGLQGIQGEQGAQGIQDTQSIQGVQGEQGIQGVQGIQDIQEDGVIKVSSISELKAGDYASSSEVVLENQTLAFVFRNGRNIFVKDDSGALHIDDNKGVITKFFVEGDNIDHIQGNIKVYGGMNLFIPSNDVSRASFNYGKIEPIHTSINDIETNYEVYESQLVKLNDVVFAGGNYTLNAATNLNISQNEKTIQCRNYFKTLSMAIPNNTHANITGFVGRYNNNYKIYPRDNNDIEII